MEKMVEILDDICVRNSKWVDDERKSIKTNLMIWSFSSKAHVSMVKMPCRTCCILCLKIRETSCDKLHFQSPVIFQISVLHFDRSRKAICLLWFTYCISKVKICTSTVGLNFEGFFSVKLNRMIFTTTNKRRLKLRKIQCGKVLL